MVLRRQNQGARGARGEGDGGVLAAAGWYQALQEMLYFPQTLMTGEGRALRHQVTSPGHAAGMRIMALRAPGVHGGSTERERQ